MFNNSIKDEIVEVSKLLYTKNMANAYEGNLSIKHNNNIYITPSGKCKGYISPDMIVVTDLDGNIVEETSYKASSEIILHLNTYKKREDINSIIHAHPVYSTAFAIAGLPIYSDSYAELNMFFKQIPISPYERPGSIELFKSMENLIIDYNAILMKNHGIICFGKNLLDTFFVLETIEGIAKTILMSKLLNNHSPISEKDLLLLRNS